MLWGGFSSSGGRLPQWSLIQHVSNIFMTLFLYRFCSCTTSNDWAAIKIDVRRWQAQKKRLHGFGIRPIRLKNLLTKIKWSMFSFSSFHTKFFLWLNRNPWWRVEDMKGQFCISDKRWAISLKPQPLRRKLLYPSDRRSGGLGIGLDVKVKKNVSVFLRGIKYPSPSP
jgi:hypothetical protein